MATFNEKIVHALARAADTMLNSIDLLDRETWDARRLSRIFRGWYELEMKLAMMSKSEREQWEEEQHGNF